MAGNKLWFSTGNGFRQLVFLLYNNDFRKKVQGNFNIIQFADDTGSHFSKNNVAEREKCVPEILEKTHNYLKKNKLKIALKLNFFASRKNETFDPLLFRGQETKP